MDRLQLAGDFGEVKVVAIAATVILPCNILAAQDFRVADSIVERGIRSGIFPGAVLVLGRAAAVTHSRGFGHFTWKAGSPVPSPDSTLWDLASLTKVVGTTSAIMRLYEGGLVDLDAPVARYLPGFSGAGRDRVLIRQLLDHSSGLPSYLEFFRLTRTRDSAIALLYRTPLRRPPGGSAEYSDLNFLLLGLVAESVGREPLERVVARAVLEPAGMRHSRYRPGPTFTASTAPTGQWRGHAICCEVNDQNAVRMGGAAGHAGLFSTGADLARFARVWLNRGQGVRQRVFQPATIERFLTPASSDAPRLLGWERPDPRHRDDSAYGHLLSTGAYGHTGWTGTFLWVDPDRDLFLVLLTNRSFGPRIGHSIRALRALRGALSDAVVRESDARSAAPASGGPR